MDLKDLIEDAGYEVRSYSGRGMYGKTCLAFSTDDRLGDVVASILDAIAAYTEMDRELALDLASDFRSMKSDSMGLGRIFYFESVDFEEPETFEDDEDEESDGERYATTNPDRERFGGAG